MPVSKEELAQYVTELGLPQDQTDSLVTTLMGNEKAATQFVGQRMRHSDYTKKTQDLASQRTEIERNATAQITEYATQLSTAQNRINAIMADMEKEQISAATANARLRKVKETYNLTDADIPAIEGVAKPAGTADPDKGPVDLDKRLGAFRDDLLKTIRADLFAMPRITAIQSDIAAEHLELTGKRLSRTEMNDLLTKAEKDKVRLEDAWKDQYKVDDLRQTKRDDENKKKWQSEWETEHRKRVSDDAIAGVRRVDPTQDSMNSPILRKKFDVHSDPVSSPDKSNQPSHTPSQSGPRPTGAERAAAKFLERRANGIPIGASAQ
jgi:hypothetical protein